MDAATIAASAGAWAWKEFGEDIKGGFGEFLKRKFKDAKESNEKAQYVADRWMDFQWGTAAERYRDHMQKLYGHIRVLGSTEPVDLDELFTDVYILERPQAFRRFNMSELQTYQQEPDKLTEEKRLPGLRVIQRKMGQRLYLLGKPGAGKTTFLKFLVHLTLQGKLDKLPIFVTIKDWANSELDLLSFIVKQFDICQLPAALSFIEYLLETGRAIVLCDGLDEVPQEAELRTRLTTALHDFCKKYLQTQVVITCRVAASDYAFTEFTYLEMADFDDQQLKTYARKWFNKAKEKADGFLVELSKPENKGVRELGRSPLLLSLICLTYDETLHIPQRRVELYEEALEALLKKWDASRNIRRDEAYKKLSLGRKRQMFARLAAESFEKGEIFFPEKQLGRQIEEYLKGLPPADAAEDPDGAVVLRAIAAQHGIMVERAQGIYAFAHLMFQEYYTARYIVDHVGSGTLEGLMKHLHDQRWREVFLLTASMLDNASDFFTLLQAAWAAPIRADPQLLEIQRWSERKALSVPGLRPSILRCIYYVRALDLASALDRDLALDRDRDHDLALANDPPLALSRDLDPARFRDIARDLARDHALSLIIFRNLALNLALNLARDIALNLLARDIALNLLERTIDRALERTIDRALDRTIDRALDQLMSQDVFLDKLPVPARRGGEIIILDKCLFDGLFSRKIFTSTYKDSESVARWAKLEKYYSLLQILAQSANPELSAALITLPLPGSDAPYEAWQKFEQTLRALAIQYCDIGHNWELNEDQVNHLTQYFQANRLLLDCLQVAYVSNREAILDKVLTVD